MSAPAWHLLTGELARGGIGDYTRLLADALADAGREVHVWSPDAAGVALRRAAVHPLPGVGAAGLRELDAALHRFRAPRRLLVQYAPQAWGMRGMNVPFCRWLLSRRRVGDDVRVMFHEPFFPFGWQRPQRNLLAAVNRWMARLLLRTSAPRAFVSISAWEKLLRPLAPRGLEFAVLPIPSTIPFVDDPARVAALRRELSEDGRRPVFVHFGTYGDLIASMLARALASVVASYPDARIVLLGDRGPAFADRLKGENAALGETVYALGFLSGDEVSLHLQAASVAIQPYPDGADTRRTSLMACLANGVPTVTTRGRFTGMLLSQAPMVRCLPVQPSELGSRAVTLLADPAVASPRARDHTALRRETRAYYAEHFAIGHTVARLLADEGGG